MNKRKNKYNNSKRGGSTKEDRRYKELLNLEAEGIISGLQRQVPFELIPKQSYQGKFAEHACKYIADFVYYLDGEMIVEDVKSSITRKKPDYVIKRKLMLYHLGIKLREEM